MAAMIYFITILFTGQFRVPDAANTPGGRTASSIGWVDNNNNLWLYGGVGATGHYNDVWRYNIATNEWTWMNGPQGSGRTGNYGQFGC